MLKTWLLGNKPYTIFDATNAEHRQAYYDFLKNKSWSSCRWQFILEDSYSDLPSFITQKLVNYYTSQEFSEKKIKTKVYVK